MFNNFFRELQTLGDSGDPINHICECANLKPLHLIKVIGDTVVPNNSTDRLITAGDLKKLSALGPNAVGPGMAPSSPSRRARTVRCSTRRRASPRRSRCSGRSVLFAASAVQPGGPFVVITDPTVIQP